MNVIREFSAQSTIETFSDIMQKSGPLFFARIGGSDYDVVLQHYNHPGGYSLPEFFDKVVYQLDRRLFSIRSYRAAKEKVENYNGYFDFSHDREKFFRYLQVMTKYYRSADHYFYGGSTLLKAFDQNSLGRHRRFLEEIAQGKIMLHYSFLEAVLPFLYSFQRWGEGKRILVVSPLSKSVEHQNQHRNELIKNYKFPNFSLVTVNSPITYNGVGDTASSLGVASQNWDAAAAQLNEQISQVDFDIAWLSCGSYSMSAGHHIKNVLGRKAIYIGGMLNVFFNIYGGRYNTAFFNNLVHLKTQIDPIENDQIEQIKGGRMEKTESLNAYFGRRPKDRS